MENSTNLQDHNQAVLRYNWEHLVFLIAEDIEMNYLFLAEALKKTGVKVLWAMNGQQAVEMVQSIEKIDIFRERIRRCDGRSASRSTKEEKKSIKVST